MKNSKWIILFFVIFLVSCTHDPMIRLSAERQAEIAEKEKIASEQSQAATPVASAFEMSGQKTYDQAMVFDDMTAFIPIQPNQVMKFQKGTSEFQRYMDFVDGGLQQIQMRTQSLAQNLSTIYTWSNDAIEEYMIFEDAILPTNHLQADLTTTVSRKILSAPIQVGTQWDALNQQQAEITQLYQELVMNGQTFHDVVEVSFMNEANNVTSKLYIAKSVGIIAEVTDEVADTMFVTGFSQNTYYQQEVNIYVPTVADNLNKLITKAVSLTWQTNDDLANIYTKLFTAENWLNQSVKINQIALLNNQLSLDFTPGVVAAMNANEFSEVGVLPAIVATLTHHFDVDSVALTVNGLGLLPDILPYPDGGIWSFNEQWLENLAVSNE